MVKLSELSFNIYGCASREGVGITGAQHMCRGDLLAIIPKTAVLSAVNTEAADILDRSNLGGGLALIFAIMYERHVMGSKSRW